MRSFRFWVIGIAALLTAGTSSAFSAVVTDDPAPVSMVVFSDFSCPYSSQLFFELEKLKDKYQDKITIRFKQSPLPTHPEAPLAHRAALAAGRQGKFLEMSALIYSNQKHLDLDSMLSYARHLHLNVSQFHRDLDSDSVKAELNADMDESRAFAIDQTPTMFIAGKSLIGIQTVETLSTLIDKTEAPENNLPPAIDGSGAAVAPALLAEMQKSLADARGAANASLTIVEFTDFQCPYCRAAVEPLKQLMAARGREVRWVVHNFPLDFHPYAQMAAEAVMAAGDQGKFWEMHDLLFENQSALKPDDLRGYAQQLHLDMNAYDEAMRTHRFAGDVAADRELGIKAGVDGTPTMFIDGIPMSGAKSLPELEQIADAHAAQHAGQPTMVAAVAGSITPKFADQQVLGPKDGATVTVTWFTDVRSPLAKGQADLIRDLSRQYERRLRVFFRGFPLESHADGRLAGQALVAALKQDKFWEVYDALAARRDLLDNDKIMAIVTGLGLDRDSFSQAMDAAAPDLNANIAEATRRGILGAPVIFLNDKRVDGLQRSAFYTAILDSEIKKPAIAQTARAMR